QTEEEMRGAACAVLLAWIVCVARGVRADSGGAADARAEAQRHVAQGLAEHGKGNLAAALGEFRAAYSLVLDPRILYNIAQEERALQKPVEALEHYERFLAEMKPAPAEPDLGRRIDTAEKAVAELHQQLGQLEIVTEPGVEVLLD